MSKTAYAAISITPSDTVAISGGPCQVIWVGTGGDITYISPNQGATTVTLKNVPSGYMLQVECTRVNATNTTASDLVAMFI